MIKKIKTFFWELFRAMPLDDNFKNYDEYWKNRGFHAPSLNRAKIISQHIKSESRILDIGCGDGTIMEYLSKNNKPQEIIGIDISQKAVNFVNEKGFKAFKFDIFSDEFAEFLKDKKFDYIIITEVLEHVQNPEIIMNLIKKHVLDSIFVSIPNAGFFVNRIRLLFGKFPLAMIQQHIKEHIRFWTLTDFLYWCTYLGFNIDSYFVSSGLYFKPLEFLEKLSPSLFAQQII
ncbi:bifunctional 3-demethylubiquinone-9 3-methyltransferase/ 2-octaprenyl-6-hydroxy phenol methylase [bacterium BMS3Abin15]|nr:bifunctional 3-demethylubiquinone-9 3-methyltransferase/ 2-octaprenyl-6-hydroxy phenol methylase [bacterium BMS3Abin15]